MDKISGKTPEAKGNKSYNMLSILSERISENHILDLVLPLKEVKRERSFAKVEGWGDGGPGDDRRGRNPISPTA